jgi:hypothetical protein
MKKRDCDSCGDSFTPSYRGQEDCRPCIGRDSLDPAEIAERQELENRSDGLEEPWWRNP